MLVLYDRSAGCRLTFAADDIESDLGFREERWHGDHEGHGPFLEFCQNGPLLASRFLIIRRIIFLKRMKQDK
jgi:hypothetical protein